jgi:hypothetical protein
MGSATVQRALRGEFTRGALLAFLSTILAAIAALLGTSWVLYDTCNPGKPYDLLVNQISHLGNPEQNPCGFYFFPLALWTLAFSAIPLLRFYRRVLPTLQARVTGVFVVLFALGIPGTTIVGFFPSSVSYTMHIIGAGLALGGMGLAFLLSGFGFITSKIRVHNVKIPPALVIASNAFIAFVIIGLTVVGYTFALDIFNDVEGTWLSFSLWEWLLLGAICVMCAATSLPLAARQASEAGERM